MRNKCIFWPIMAVVMTLQSCGSEEVKAPEIQVPAVVVEETDSTLEESYSFVPPSPLQIASVFKKAGLTYDASLPNKVEHLTLYTNKFVQSVNFGVYSADLAYCVKNEKYDQASKYLKVLKELSTKIGLETVFGEEDLLDRFNANLGKQDSIVNILIQVQQKTDDYIAQNKKMDLAVVYYSGAWIEGMYFGAIAAQANPTKPGLGNLLSEQLSIGRSIVKGLLALKNLDIDAQDLAASISEIISFYDGLASVKSLGADAEYLDITLTKEEILELSTKIVSLRNSIIK